MRARFWIIMTVLLLVGVSLPAQAQSRSAIYEQAMEAYRTSNFGSAELLFRKIIESDNEYRDRAWYYMAVAVYRQKKYETAMFELNRFLLVSTTPELSMLSRFWIGECYNQMGEPIKAIEEYRRFLGQYKGGETTLIMTAYERVAGIYMSQKRFDEAAIEYEKALAMVSDPQNIVRINFQIISLRIANEDYKAALELAEEMMQKVGTEEERYILLLLSARARQQLGEYQQALVSLSFIPETAQTKGELNAVRYYKALSYNSLGRRDEALNLLEYYRSNERTSITDQALLFMGIILLEGSRSADGYGLLHGLADRKDVTDEIRQNTLRALAGYNMRSARPWAAAAQYRQMYGSSVPAEADRAYDFAEALVQCGEYAEAQSIITEVNLKNPYHAERDRGIFLDAAINILRGNTELASDQKKRLEQEYPFSRFIAEIPLYQAWYYYGQKNYNQALTYVKLYLSSKAVYAYQGKILQLKILSAAGAYSQAALVSQELVRSDMWTKGLDDYFLEYLTMLESANRFDDLCADYLLKNNQFSEAAAFVKMHRARVLFDARRYVEAMELFLDVSRMSESVFAAEAYYRYSLSLQQAGMSAQLDDFWQKKPLIIWDNVYTRKLVLLQAVQARSTGNLERARELLSYFAPVELSNDERLLYLDVALKTGDTVMPRVILSISRPDQVMFRQVLEKIAGYLVESGQYDLALYYYQRMIDECEAPDARDSGRLGVAAILARKGDTQKAYSVLSEVVTVKGRQNAAALKILLLYRSGKSIDADKALIAAGASVHDTVYGEELLLEAVKNAATRKEQAAMQRFAEELLVRYPHNAQFVAYQNGLYFISIKQYQQAYYWLYRVTTAVTKYSTEAYYLCGMIAWQNLRDYATAVQFLRKAIENGRPDDLVVEKAVIMLCLIYNETGRQQDANALMMSKLDWPRFWNNGFAEMVYFGGMERVLLMTIPENATSLESGQ